jgi:cytoskeletal protein RodZ
MFVVKLPSDNSQELKIRGNPWDFLGGRFSETRIRSSYLEAIEKKEFHLLPDPVYNKKFIKTYAKFLGLDEKPIIQDYDDFINTQKKERIQPQEEISAEEKHHLGTNVS